MQLGLVVGAATATDELVRVATRVVVMRNGRIVTELEGDAINPASIERAQLAIADRTGENAAS